MKPQTYLAGRIAVLLTLAIVTPAIGEEKPRSGGILTYMIPADAPPSFDGHREATYATVHAAAPYYSVLIRVNPENPASPTDFVCDLCTEMPQPTDDGRTYTFKIRDGVKFHDGSPLTAVDVAASWQRVVSPPAGVTSARQAFYTMVDKVESPDPRTVVFRLKFATTAFLPALADPFAYIYKKAALDQDQHWYEKNILGSGPFKFVRYETGPAAIGARPARKGAGRPDRRPRERLELRQPAYLQSQEKAVRRRSGTPRLVAGDRPVERGAGAVEDCDRAHGRRDCVPRLAARGHQGGTAAARRVLARYRKVARRGKASLERGRRGKSQLRDAEPRCRSAFQIHRHLCGR